jgi:hypothetical protein
MSFQDAVTLGFGVTSAALGLYQSLKLVLPISPISVYFMSGCPSWFTEVR